jgi:urea transport system permease protein
MRELLNGRIEPGKGPVFWIVGALLVIGMLFLPGLVGRYTLLNFNSFLLMVFLATGLALLWGFCGVLSLGQSAFFGIGGYAYGIVAINLADSPWASLAGVAGGIVAAVVFAALLGWLTFYGHLRGVYVSIVTLVVTLVIESFLNQTAGPQWKIGTAHLGGNNGLGRFSGAAENIPSLTIPTGGGNSLVISGSSPTFYYVLIGLIVFTYLLLRALVNSRFGVALAAVREDPDRAETLGYDIRLLQSMTFCIGAALAAMSGLLYVAWGNFITPSVFGVTANVLPVIWVAVAGRKSLAAAILGAVVLQWGAQQLAISGGEWALIVQGALLVLVVLLLPEGLLSLRQQFSRMRDVRSNSLKSQSRQG